MSDALNAPHRGASMPIPKTVVSHHFSFVCQKRWEELVPTKSPSTRHCVSCAQDVHLCDSVAALREHSHSGHCIAYRMPSSASRHWWQFWKPKPQCNVVDLPSCGMGPVLLGMPAPPAAPPETPPTPPALPPRIRDHEHTPELLDKIFRDGVPVDK